ncbi:ROK family protein [Methanofollis fontis]|uniref:ROK family protein n=1 Tax=Methanofollis fontis TaxID=2052832 RepID=A0A483CVW9_9EURY|nr:ROK family protein [Methanofollis fontis]TAJ45671.1 ROK family protein [Methanofollis fontis]
MDAGLSGDAVVAADVGATHIRAAVVERDGTVRRHLVRTTPRSGPSGDAVTDAVFGMIAALLDGGGVQGIGIAAAGPLDPGRGAIVGSPNMAFDEVCLTGPLRERFGLPVTLLNDCRAGVLGEHWQGAGQGIGDLVYVTLSTGIGGGAIVNGCLLSGRDGNAGEIGHLFVEGDLALPCGCGHRGHWEGYASGSGMPRFCTAWCERKGVIPAFDASSSRGILEAAEAGDPVAALFMEALGEVNARGISDLIVAYAPEVIVLDGPLAQAHGRLLIGHMLPHIDRYLPLPEIRVSTLGGRAPLLGAAWSVFSASSPAP